MKRKKFAAPAEVAEREEDEDERTTVSIRNVSVRRWKAVQQKADREGRKLRAVLDEMFDWYLNQ